MIGLKEVFDHTIIELLKPYYFSFSRCHCKGCKIDDKKPVSTKKWYERWFSSFKEFVSYDLTSNLVSTGFITWDVVTDIKTGLEHWNNGDVYWAIATWLFMFIPAVLSFLLEISCRTCKMSSLRKVLGHLPLAQTIYLLYILKKVKLLKEEMKKHQEFYNAIDYDRVNEEQKKELKERCKKYHKAKRDYLRLLSDIQTQRLYEGFAESAPELVLQISIIFTTGKCSKWVLLSVISSFISLAKCATNTFLTMPTIGKDIKEACWKTKFFFVLPCMLIVIPPRILTLSIMASYLKEWIVPTIFLMGIIICLANVRFILRDKKMTVLGCLTNIFAPVVIMDDGSSFFFKSSLISNLTHGCGLILLSILVLFHGIGSMVALCAKTLPSMFYCFNDVHNFENYSAKRCPFQGNIQNFICLITNTKLTLNEDFRVKDFSLFQLRNHVTNHLLLIWN